MKIEIKKAEALILRRAIRDIAWLIYRDKELWGEDIYDRTLGYNYKVSLLKNLARIELKINREFRKTGYLKKRTGNVRCWSLWTTTSKRCQSVYRKLEEKYQEGEK